MLDRSRLKVLLVSVWVIFTVSLSIWWMIFGIRMLEHMTEFEGTIAEQLHRKQAMLLWEGGILILSLLVGGGALLWYVIREKRRYQMIRDFFTTFSHDVKTRIASLRLQVESLEEEGKTDSPILKRLKDDSVRLQLQLENSLFAANLENVKLYPEKTSLREVVETLKHHWPHVNIEMLGQADSLVVDRRVLESIIGNLILNSVLHGKATNVQVIANEQGPEFEIVVKDNGVGFSGDFSQLGKEFARPTPTSGSGIGLHLIHRLTQIMKGRVEYFSVQGKGFTATLHLPKGAF